MADEILILNGNQFHEVFKELHDEYQEALFQANRRRSKPLKTDPVAKTDFPGFHYTKWQNIERFYNEKEWHATARYLCYMRDGHLLGVNKVYVDSAEKHFNNAWRVSRGLAPVTGNWWGHRSRTVPQKASFRG